jgi:hypothetical protein
MVNNEMATERIANNEPTWFFAKEKYLIVNLFN